MLQTENTPIDLVLRGFSREVVLDRTGVDVGYNGRSLREEASGTDRVAYKIEHVRQRVDSTAVLAALDVYAAGADKVATLAALGLAGENTVKLKELFAGLGLADEFSHADRAHRTGIMRQGMLDKHGVANPFELEAVQKQAAETREERYGAAYTLASGSSLAEGARAKAAEKMDETVAKRVATRARNHPPKPKRESQPRRPLTSDEIAARSAKARYTSILRYGVPHPSQRPEFRERASKWMRDHAEEVAVLRQEAYFEKYGVGHPVVSEDRRAVLSVRMSDPAYQRHLVEVRRERGTLATSFPEEHFYALLVERFGSDDVVRQHRDDVRYPFSCDFYIPSRDLFVELNGSWTHGGHWCDSDRAVDAKKLAKWQSKVDDGSAYYANAIYVWTDLDARKRESARKHSLNYVVLWDGSEGLLDAHLWLSLGMPDGRDWEREYSWLEDRSLDASIPWPKALDERPRTAISAARAANGEALYSRELAAWYADDVHARSWGRTRARILANRLRHVGKAPDVLRDIEALRGFGISGALRAHTAFDNGGMVEVLEEFSPTRVYDPCAGWGERMATCAALGIEYLGVDINEAVVEGHARMAAQYGLSTQRTVHADAAQHDASGFNADLVFTCPPYGDVEIYTEHGAENLDDDAFLAWWGEVVDCSVGPSTEVFAFQVNQLWRDRMVAVLEDRGWRLERRIDVGRGRVSHFNRASDGTSQKREFEQIQVLVRV